MLVENYELAAGCTNVCEQNQGSKQQQDVIMLQHEQIRMPIFASSAETKFGTAASREFRHNVILYVCDNLDLPYAVDSARKLSSRAKIADEFN